MRNAKSGEHCSENNHDNYTLGLQLICMEMQRVVAERKVRCQRLGSRGNIMRSAICMNYYQEYYCEYQ